MLDCPQDTQMQDYDNCILVCPHFFRILRIFLFLTPFALARALRLILGCRRRRLCPFFGRAFLLLLWDFKQCLLRIRFGIRFSSELRASDTVTLLLLLLLLL